MLPCPCGSGARSRHLHVEIHGSRHRIGVTRQGKNAGQIGILAYPGAPETRLVSVNCLLTSWA